MNKDHLNLLRMKDQVKRQGKHSEVKQNTQRKHTI